MGTQKTNKETELLQFVPRKTQRNTQLHKWDGAPHSTACRSWTNSSNSSNPSCLVHTWCLFCCTKLWNLNEPLRSMTLQDLEGCMHWVLESIPPANTVHPSSEQLFKTLVKAGQSPGNKRKPKIEQPQCLKYLEISWNHPGLLPRFHFNCQSPSSIPCDAVLVSAMVDIFVVPWTVWTTDWTWQLSSLHVVFASLRMTETLLLKK